MPWLKGWKLLDKPNILLLDSHKTHRFLQLMKEFNITVLAIPAHTSHCTQPLDKTPFATLKREWNENLLAYLFDHVGCGLPKIDFFSVFWPTWQRSMTSQNVQSGFKRTGISPFNPNIINPAVLGPSQATDNLVNLNTQGKEMFMCWCCFHLQMFTLVFQTHFCFK